MPKFVSCVLNIADSETPEIGICEAQLDHELTSLEDTLQTFHIKKLVLSEGCDIFTKEDVSIGDLHFYPTVLEKGLPIQDNGDELHKTCVWYEFLKLITAHKIYCDKYQIKYKFSRWGYRFKLLESSQLTMELKLGTVRKKIAEITLVKANSGEMDLFDSAYTLYLSVCLSNDEYTNVESKIKELNMEIAAMKDERAHLDKILEERDNKTRAMMVGLLNSKKRKILALEKRLDRFEHEPKDSDVINKHIISKVSTLNSPGKRKRVSGPAFQERPRKKNKVEGSDDFERGVSKSMKIEDDFDNFQFYGISTPRKLDLQQDEESSTPHVKIKEEPRKLDFDYEATPKFEEPSVPVGDSIIGSTNQHKDTEEFYGSNSDSEVETELSTEDVSLTP
ncbi:Lif1p KNAG_0F02150 [Huiozyma naganishii CBS 8797]|uniref:Uncharacterized protein n=1 Tax=Huiozyma naganishii (strain ATCC MYA-139 / BCRC 22969 / CBS 8797 / KCTC 17520 / NBRC 10181 / NCYC 3082 / Yp74L-3) TaxID=1071383 RepID=J7S038_HUIN7|nr:hypothetical protein KNAG_0F02150 [Kazachstania naganishii CBS 8797]CCK70882.1 hypothetical protein KNAG_0F02150 [Kazachstania naganishii CBS 8797]